MSASKVRSTRRWKAGGTVLLFAVLSSVLVASVAGQSGRPADLCYVFAGNGDIVLHCQGRKTQLTKRGDITSFAVDPEGRALAFISGTRQHRLTLIPFSKTIQRRTFDLATNAALSASCGSIVLSLPDPSVGYRLTLTKDLLQDSELYYPPYRNVRCSSDRKTIVGWTDPVARVLNAGLPPGPPIANGVDLYDVTPDGTHIAYYYSGKLCLSKEGSGSSKCLSDVDAFGGISVPSAAGILFTSHLKQECFYRDEYHASKVRRRGYVGRDACTSVAYWDSGSESVVTLETLARDGQFVTPTVAAALLRWSARSPSGR